MEKRLTMFLAGIALSTGVTLAQTQISGTVTSSDDGQPVVGASVMIDGTKTGTVTDIDGHFTLDAKPGAKLVINYIGMQPKTVKAGGNMKIVMTPDNKTLDEVMVVAYGTQKKSSFTGSAAVLKSDDIAKVADSNPVQALTGKVSGVQINTATGQPGAESFNIRIRGISSINAGNNPLIVLDGAPFDGDMNDINPNDIASMTVLKDAASAALYGARGANGVVIITTKTGREGATNITFDAKWGGNSRAVRDYKYVKSPATYYETWYKGLYNYAVSNKGYSGDQAYAWANKHLCTNDDYGLGYQVYSVPNGEYLIGKDGKLNSKATLGHVVDYNGSSYLLTPDDWTDATYRTGLRQEYALTATASSDRGSFYGSANYLSNEGITANSDYKRFTGRMKADYQLRSWLKIGGNFSYSHTNTNYLSVDDDGASTSSGNVFALTTVAPIYPLYVRDKDGNILYNSTAHIQVYDYGDGSVNGQSRPYISQANPLSSNQLDTHNANGNTFNATGFAEIRFLKDFKFTSTNSVLDAETRTTLTTNPYYGQYAASNGQVTIDHSRRWSYNYQQLLDWHHLFGKHDVDVMLGHEYYRTRYYDLDAYKTNMYSFDVPELDAAVKMGNADSYTNDYNTEGWFGRAQYNYAEKYFGSLSYRRDASSRFAPENRWGNFWSFGAAWLINKEKFFHASWVDELKLKLSYGEQGNDNITDLDGRDQYLYTNTYNVVTSNGEPALTPKTMGNRDVTWEKGGNFNVGTDFSLFKGRLTGSAEYFYRKTSDMLFYFPLPTSYGYTGYYANIGDMRNSGFEFDLDGAPIKTKDLEWRINLNLTTYGNKITRLPEERRTMTVDGISGFSSGNYFYGEGKSIYTWYMPKYAGVDPETGEALYYKDVTDANGNVTGQEKTADYSEATEHLCGTALPDVYGGFGTSVSWKGLDASVNFTYQLGGKVFDSSYAESMELTRGRIFHEDMLNAWSETNKSSNIPRIQFNDSYTAATSDRFLTSGSYLCLQDFTVGYTLPKDWTFKIGLSKVRFYVQGNNLFLWSKRQGLDPRQSVTGETNATYYSPIRTVSGGISVSF